MSVRAMSWVFAYSKATGNDRLVLLAIADRANDEGTDAWPSIPTLALKVLASERTVQRSLQTLEALGEIEVTRSPGGHSSNRYRVVMPSGDSLSPRQVDTGDTHDTAAVTPVSSDTSLRPKTPQPPASGGRSRRAHCDKHNRYRSDCTACRIAENPPTKRPDWCGDCDQGTRLTHDPDTAKPTGRCPNCHPLRNHSQTRRTA